jgi:hypothetical protein
MSCVTEATLTIPVFTEGPLAQRVRVVGLPVVRVLDHLQLRARFCGGF